MVSNTSSVGINLQEGAVAVDVVDGAVVVGVRAGMATVARTSRRPFDARLRSVSLCRSTPILLPGSTGTVAVFNTVPVLSMNSTVAVHTTPIAFGGGPAFKRFKRAV